MNQISNRFKLEINTYYGIDDILSLNLKPLDHHGLDFLVYEKKLDIISLKKTRIMCYVFTLALSDHITIFNKSQE